MRGFFSVCTRFMNNKNSKVHVQPSRYVSVALCLNINLGGPVGYKLCKTKAKGNM